jgi:hypothetical protein
MTRYKTTAAPLIMNKIGETGAQNVCPEASFELHVYCENIQFLRHCYFICLLTGSDKLDFNCYCNMMILSYCWCTYRAVVSTVLV